MNRKLYFFIYLAIVHSSADGLSKKVTITSKRTVKPTYRTTLTNVKTAAGSRSVTPRVSGVQLSEAECRYQSCEGQEGKSANDSPVCTGNLCNCTLQPVVRPVVGDPSPRCKPGPRGSPLICFSCDRCKECQRYTNIEADIKNKDEANRRNACDPNPCLYGGTCTPDEPGSLRYSCECPPGHDPDDSCHYCSYGKFGEKCESRCGICFKGGVGEPEKICHPETGCQGCAKYWYGAPTCEKVQCHVAERDNINPCSPGFCKNDQCICPPGLNNPKYKRPNCKGKRTAPKEKPCGFPCRQGKGYCYLVENEPMCYCPDGYYMDINDPLNCIKGCKEGSENCMFGRCIDEECICLPGYQGVECDRECDKFRFGINCKGFCGECRVQPCDKITGECGNAFNALNGALLCVDGFVPPFCKIPKDLPTAMLTARVLYAFGGTWVYGFEVVGSPERLGFLTLVRAVGEKGCTNLQMTCFTELQKLLPGSVQVISIISGNASEGFKADGIMGRLRKSLASEAKKQPAPKGYKFQSMQVLDVFNEPGPTNTNIVKENSSQWSQVVLVVVGFVVIMLIPTVAIILTLRKRNRSRKMRRMPHTNRNNYISTQQGSRIAYATSPNKAGTLPISQHAVAKQSRP